LKIKFYNCSIKSRFWIS